MHFINMAENLGIDPGEAEDMVDIYLDEADAKSIGLRRSTASLQFRKRSKPRQRQRRRRPSRLNRRSK